MTEDKNTNKRVTSYKLQLSACLQVIVLSQAFNVLHFGRDAEVGDIDVDKGHRRDLLVVQDLALSIHPNQHANLHDLVKGAENKSPVGTSCRKSHQLNELFVALVPHHDQKVGLAVGLKHVQPLADLLEVGEVKTRGKRNFKLNSLYL